MPLVFSLPFCLLLPDGDYQMKLDKNEIVTLNLTKVLPKVFDERLPYRGFLKGELENIATLWAMNKKGHIGWISVDNLSQIAGAIFVTKYKTKDGKEIVPEVESSLIDKDVDVSQDVNINQERFVKSSNDQEVLNRPETIKRINSDRRAHELGRKLVLNSEINKDPFGRFRYTKVRFSMKKEINFEEQFRVAIKATNILVTKYRQITYDYWITKVREEDIFIYKSVDDDSFDQSYAAKGIVQMRSDHSQNVVQALRESLISDLPEFPFIHLYLDAKNALERADYYLAVILSVAALESIIKTYLSIYSQNSPPIIQEEVIRINLRRLVSTVLRKIFPTDDYKKLIDNVTKAIDLRNDIIHESEIDVPNDKAENAVEAVGRYMEFIYGKFSNFSYNSSNQSDEIF
jgi:hypothetical protein